MSHTVNESCFAISRDYQRLVHENEKCFIFLPFIFFLPSLPLPFSRLFLSFVPPVPFLPLSILHIILPPPFTALYLPPFNRIFFTFFSSPFSSSLLPPHPTLPPSAFPLYSSPLLFLSFTSPPFSSPLPSSSTILRHSLTPSAAAAVAAFGGWGW